MSIIIVNFLKETMSSLFGGFNWNCNEFVGSISTSLSRKFACVNRYLRLILFTLHMNETTSFFEVLHFIEVLLFWGLNTI